jgi:hypothetical protein
MATETAILANETEIANAMKVLRLGEWTEDLLNEIELDRELAISIAQADAGKTKLEEEGWKFVSIVKTKHSACPRG